MRRLFIGSVITVFILSAFSAYAGQLEFDGVPVDITTADNEDLVLAPGTGGNTQIGVGSGTATYATTQNDLHITGILESDGAGYLDSTLTVTGALTANSNVALGDSSSDTITPTGRFGANIVPSADSTYSIGTSSLAFSDSHTDTTYGYNSAYFGITSGNVGIYTTAPLGLLQVGTTTISTPAFIVKGGTGSINVGIGTTAPGASFAIGSGSPASITAASSAYITGDLEVSGVIYGNLPAGSIPFSGISSGTNIAAQMVVGTGANMSYAGTGTIDSSTLQSYTWEEPGTIGSTTPSTADVTTLTTTGNAGIGTTDPTHRLDVAGGTITAGGILNATGTIDATSDNVYGANIVFDTDSASSNNVTGGLFGLNAGYTGSGLTRGAYIYNNAAGTQTFSPTTYTGNLGALVAAGGSGTDNVALYSEASSGTNLNIGSYAKANTATAGTNVGYYSLVGSGSTYNIGGYFGFAGLTALDTSAALIADNGTSSSPIFLARDNSEEVFSIINGGNTGIGTTAPLGLLEVATTTISAPALFVMGGTSTGNVGIGTTGPFAMLSVGDSTPSYISAASSAYIKGDLEVSGSIYGNISGGSVPFSLVTAGTNAENMLTIGTGSELNYEDDGIINATQLLGATWVEPGTIGSTTPATGAFTTLGVGIGAGETPIGLMQVGTSPASGLTVLSGGNVGIGTTNPGEKLAVISEDTAFGSRLEQNVPSGASGDYYGALITNSTDVGSTANSIMASYHYVNHAAANTLSSQKALVTDIYQGAGGGSADDVYSIKMEHAGLVQNAASTIDNFYALHIGNITSVGTINNTYGMYIGDLTSGTQTNTPYSIYSADSGVKMYHGGNVGIGTTSPGAKLDVTGTEQRFGSDVGSAVDHILGLNTGQAIKLVSNYSQPNDTTFTIRMWDGAFQDRLHIDNAGNVGIGTTAPLGLLAVGTTTIASPAFIVQGGAGSINVGIGTTAPATAFSVGQGTPGLASAASSAYVLGDLEVDGIIYGNIVATSMPFSSLSSGTNTQAQMVVGTGANLTYADSGTIDASKLIGSTWVAPGTIGSTTPATGAFTTLGVGIGAGETPIGLMQVGTSPYSGLTVLDSGYVGIGTTAPAVLLDIDQSTNGSGLRIRDYNSTNYWDIAFVTPPEDALQFYFDGIQKVAFKSDGNVGIGTTAIDSLLHIESTTAAPELITERNAELAHSDDVGKITFKAKGTEIASIRGEVSGTSENTGVITIATTNIGTPNDVCQFDNSGALTFIYSPAIRLGPSNEYGQFAVYGTDANAKGQVHWFPNGGATYVPVLYATNIANMGKDFGWFNGVTGPRIALIDADGDSYASFGASNTDDKFEINLGGNATDLAINGSNVGIGTTGPGAKLDLRDGDSILTDSDVAHGMTTLAPTDAYSKMTTASPTGGGLDIWGFSDVGTVAGLSFHAIAGNNLSPGASALEFMAGKKSGTSWTVLGPTETAFEFDANAAGPGELVIMGSGNVGIGTTVPTATLHVAGSIKSYDTVPLMGFNIADPDDTIDSAGGVVSPQKSYTVDTVYANVTGGTNVIFSLYVVGPSGTSPSYNLAVGQTATTSMLTITSFTNTTVPAGYLIIQDIESVAGSVTMYKAMIFGHES